MRGICYFGPGMGYYVDKPFLIPATARDFEGFRRWARSSRFPDWGRIDYVSGNLEVDLGPQDLQQGVLKGSIGSGLYPRINMEGIGDIYFSGARISFPAAELSVEPDIVVILYDSVDSGRIREVRKRKEDPESVIELEGADLVVEIGKDRKRLRTQYAAAGVPELWLADVRRGLRFEVYVLEGEGYHLLSPDADGWILSPLLGPVRLRRERIRPDRWSYRLDVGEG